MNTESITKEQVTKYLEAARLFKETKPLIESRVEHIARLMDRHRAYVIDHDNDDNYWDDLGEIEYDGDPILDRNGVDDFTIKGEQVSVSCYTDYSGGYPLAEYGAVEFSFPVEYLYDDSAFAHIQAELEAMEDKKRIEREAEKAKWKEVDEQKERRELARLQEKFQDKAD